MLAALNIGWVEYLSVLRGSFQQAYVADNRGVSKEWLDDPPIRLASVFTVKSFAR